MEYGFSFGAIGPAGMRPVHPRRDPEHERVSTCRRESLEACSRRLEDAGLVTAAVNITCYRGRTAFAGRRSPASPGRRSAPSASSSTTCSSPTRREPRGRGREPLGRDDRRLTRPGSAAGWGLATASTSSSSTSPTTTTSPMRTARTRRGRNRARGTVRCGHSSKRPAGQRDLDRYAVLLCSDHGQTPVRQGATLQKHFRSVDGIVVTASNRAGMVYRLDDCRLDVPELRNATRPGAL